MMTRTSAVMMLATPTVLAISRDASLRGAQMAPISGAQTEARRSLAVEDEYVGCFADKRARVMTDMLVDYDMTPDLCRSHCEDNGAVYYATQYSNECFCGYSDDASSYEIYGEATCDTACAGDGSVNCGGTWAFSLYALGSDSSEVPTTTGGDSGEEPTVPAPTPGDYTGGQYGEDYSGDATYYGYTTEGNCAYGGDVPGMYSGMIPLALNAGQYGDSLMCGACVEGTASGEGSGSNPIPSTFKGFITDQCPECSWGDLDFSMSGDGRWDIEWNFVACPGESISFKFEGSNAFYWKLQPQGTKTPVESLTINGQEAFRTNDNFFMLEGGPWSGAQTVVTTTVEGVTETSQVSL